MEEKARFGELCCEENSKGREWFAKYVNAQVNITLGQLRRIIRLIKPPSLRLKGCELCSVWASLHGR